MPKFKRAFGNCEACPKERCPIWFVGSRLLCRTCRDEVVRVASVNESGSRIEGLASLTLLHGSTSADIRTQAQRAARKIVEMYIGHGGDDASKIAAIIESEFAMSDIRTQPDPRAANDKSPSGQLWRTWFDRVGEHATVDVINATATLVIEEVKLATPISKPAEQKCVKCGHESLFSTETGFCRKPVRTEAARDKSTAETHAEDFEACGCKCEFSPERVPTTLSVLTGYEAAMREIAECDKCNLCEDHLPEN